MTERLCEFCTKPLYASNRSGICTNCNRAMMRAQPIFPDFKMRPCLTCGRSFKSQSPSNRICGGCKQSVEHRIPGPEARRVLA